MNGPTPPFASAVGTGLRFFAFFHLNLAFSSIEEERRGEVIARCYWPLLRLAERAGPIGLEVSGYTLEEIAARDPQWLSRARALIAQGAIELIGSGYSQMIGPLVPARVTRENLRLGLGCYAKFLGARPRLALVGEQAYAAGLVQLYRDAGYDGLIMDWENPAAQHPEWPAGTQYLPQRAAGPQGENIALLWSNTTAFQQLQRFVHGDTTLTAWLDFVRGHRGRGARALCLYASDAEIFDFRPGRFKTEEALTDESEWRRLEQAFLSVDGVLCAPSAILELMNEEGAGQQLALESACVPVPVKKQRKYNLARWAVTGRDNLAINAACERIYQGMIVREQHGASGRATMEEEQRPGRSPSSRATIEEAWKELCYLWASDFRTHLTDRRWAAYCARLEAAETEWSAPPPPATAAFTAMPVTERHFAIETPALKATLDRRRGLAIESLHFAGQTRPSLGGLPHGFFDQIALAADWYTGDCVFEAPGEHKLTDLEWCAAQAGQDGNGDIIVQGRIETPKGPIEKHLRLCADRARVEFDLTFHWQDWGKGVLRLGHFTLLPEAFALDDLKLATSNGGGRESFALAGSRIEHGTPVSFLVSSSHGLGLSEGWAEIGDGITGLRIEVDRATAPLLGLLTHFPATRPGGGKSLFCQMQLSARELDDTSRPGAYRTGPRRFRFSVSRV